MSTLLREVGKSSLTAAAVIATVYATVTVLDLIDRKWIKPAVNKAVGDKKAEVKDAVAVATETVSDLAESVEATVAEVVPPVVTETAANG